jgi:glycosyltransferase involved in cell wall biosynthesis
VAELIKNEENGIVVPFEDVEMLSARTADLIENPQKRKTIGERGYQTVVNDYSMEKMCQVMEKYLLELVKK